MIRVVFLQLFEQYEEGKAYNIERTLANGLCERKIAVPFTVHQKMQREAEAAEAEAAEAKAKAEATEAEKLAKAAADKLAEKEKPERAVSKKAGTRSKAVK